MAALNNLTSIAVDREVYAELKKRGSAGDSFNDVLRRILQLNKTQKTEKTEKNLLEGYVETVVGKARVGADGKVVAVDPAEYETVRTTTQREES